MSSLFFSFISLFAQSAPWLMLGFTVAGLIKALIPGQFLSKHLGGNKLSAVLKAALIGAPMPLCSCAVIPAAISLRRSGASQASTTAFLIATPETGVDSISITYAFMGPFMAIVRPVAAIASAITAGVVMYKLEATNTAPAVNEEPASCCHCDSNTKNANSKSADSTDCAKQTASSLTANIAAGLRFSLLDLSKDIAIWLLIGLLLAALIQTYVPLEWISRWGNSWLAFVVMTAIGIPMYICATASTPIAAALLFSGVSPGAVLVFMLVGPATNFATISLVKAELGNKALAVYLGSIIGVSYLFGWFINQFSVFYQLGSELELSHTHDYSLIGIVSQLLLGLLLLRGIWLKLKDKLISYSSSTA